MEKGKTIVVSVQDKLQSEFDKLLLSVKDAENIENVNKQSIAYSWIHSSMGLLGIRLKATDSMIEKIRKLQEREYLKYMGKVEKKKAREKESEKIKELKKQIRAELQKELEKRRKELSEQIKKERKEKIAAIKNSTI
jgi:hypothetical protein